MNLLSASNGDFLELDTAICLLDTKQDTHLSYHKGRMVTQPLPFQGKIYQKGQYFYIYKQLAELSEIDKVSNLPHYSFDLNFYRDKAFLLLADEYGLLSNPHNICHIRSDKPKLTEYWANGQRIISDGHYECGQFYNEYLTAHLLSYPNGYLVIAEQSGCIKYHWFPHPRHSMLAFTAKNIVLNTLLIRLGLIQKPDEVKIEKINLRNAGETPTLCIKTLDADQEPVEYHIYGEILFDHSVVIPPVTGQMPNPDHKIRMVIYDEVDHPQVGIAIFHTSPNSGGGRSTKMLGHFSVQTWHFDFDQLKRYSPNLLQPLNQAMTAYLKLHGIESSRYLGSLKPAELKKATAPEVLGDTVINGGIVTQYKLGQSRLLFVNVDQQIRAIAQHSKQKPPEFADAAFVLDYLHTSLKIEEDPYTVDALIEMGMRSGLLNRLD